MMKLRLLLATELGRGEVVWRDEAAERDGAAPVTRDDVVAAGTVATVEGELKRVDGCGCRGRRGTIQL